LPRTAIVRAQALDTQATSNAVASVPQAQAPAETGATGQAEGRDWTPRGSHRPTPGTGRPLLSAGRAPSAQGTAPTEAGRGRQAAPRGAEGAGPLSHGTSHHPAPGPEEAGGGSGSACLAQCGGLPRGCPGRACAQGPAASGVCSRGDAEPSRGDGGGWRGAGRWPNRENGGGLQRDGGPAAARVRAAGAGEGKGRAGRCGWAESWRGAR